MYSDYKLASGSGGQKYPLILLGLGAVVLGVYLSGVVNLVRLTPVPRPETPDRVRLAKKISPQQPPSWVFLRKASSTLAAVR